MKTLLYAIFFILFLSSSVYHPIHISYTKIENKGNEIKMLVKIFSDDLTQAVQSYYNKKTISDSDFLNYILTTTKITINGKPVVFTFKGKKSQDAAEWYYFISKEHTANCNISVENNLLCNIYHDQKNLVIISCNSQEKGFSLDYSNRTCIY